MKYTDTILSVPSKASSNQKWIEWHKALKNTFGRKKANTIFIDNWEKRGNVNIINNDMQDYFRKQGVNLDKTFANQIIDFPEDVFDTIGNIFTMGKYAAIAVGVVILVPVGILLYNVAKSPDSVINAIKK